MNVWDGTFTCPKCEKDYGDEWGKITHTPGRFVKQYGNLICRPCKRSLQDELNDFLED